MPRTLRERERETLLQGYLLSTEDSICDGVRFLAVRGSPRDVWYLSALRYTCIYSTSMSVCSSIYDMHTYTRQIHTGSRTQTRVCVYVVPHAYNTRIQYTDRHLYIYDYIYIYVYMSCVYLYLFRTRYRFMRKICTS